MSKWTIRIYALILDAEQRILLSDECLGDSFFTKFPGGGLEWGEGTREGLQRELKEELGVDAEIGEHVYTTDHFVASKFHANVQLISIYYFAHVADLHTIPATTKPFDFDHALHEAESFRWVPLNHVEESHLTFPVDKIVLTQLKERFLP